MARNDFMSEEKAGFTIEQVGGSMSNAYRYAMDGRAPGGAALPLWQDLDELVQAAWVEAAKHVAEIFDEGVSIAVSLAAKSVYEHFCRVIGGGAVAIPFEATRPIDQMAWQAVVRHALNVMSMENGDDIESHEMVWREWVSKRVPQLEAAL